MTTKEQERAALAKIRKIVSDLGEDSYLGFAFDGAFELAERNIEDDAAFTTSYYIGRALGLQSAHDSDAKELHGTIKSLGRDLNDARNVIENQQSEIAGITESAKYITHSWVESQEQVKALAAQIEAKDFEIIRLKAKLYDLMTA